MKLKSTTETTISYNQEEIISILADLAARAVNTMASELKVNADKQTFTVTFTYTTNKGDKP